MKISKTKMLADGKRNKLNKNECSLYSVKILFKV